MKGSFRERLKIELKDAQKKPDQMFLVLCPFDYGSLIDNSKSKLVSILKSELTEVFSQEVSDSSYAVRCSRLAEGYRFTSFKNAIRYQQRVLI